VGNDCPVVEELVTLAILPTGDPGREHLDHCPRCQARLTTYQEFLAGETDGDLEHEDEALARLGSRLDRDIFRDEPRVSSDSTPATFHWRSPTVRVSLALAATLLFFFAIDGLWEMPGSETSELRSDPSDQQTADPFQTETLTLPDGGIELRWQPIAAADDYRIEILDGTFELMARVPVGEQPVLQLSLEKQREILPLPGAYVWTVIALQNGDELQRSPPTAFAVGSR